MVITPTIGRVVWFRPHKTDGLPTESDGRCAALVVKVWHDRLVNLAVFDANGNHHNRTSVPLVQEGDVPHADGFYAEWMPCQKSQQAKYEQLERQTLGQLGAT